MTEKSIPMAQIINEMNLDVVWGVYEYRDIKITNAGVNRPALPLTGFFELFNPQAIQVIGNVEADYLSRLSSAEREMRFDALFAHKSPLFIVAHGGEPFPECVEAAKRHGVTVAKTPERTTSFIAALSASLNVSLGPTTVMHGVLVEVYGEGILITGDSGIGKSETAIELVKRGHRLIADDAVDITRVSAKTLVGSAPELIRYFLELRGIGVIDVRRIFGMGAVKPTEKIDLVIKLERWEDGMSYARLDESEEQMVILDIPVSLLTIPIRPGRNLAVIIEVAAMNNRNKKMGHNAAKELSDKVFAALIAQQND